MNFLFITTLIIIIIVLTIPAVASLAIKKIPSSFQPPLSDSQFVGSTTKVLQSFTAKDNGLSSVALTIRNPYLRNKSDILLKVLENSTVVRSTTLNGVSIPDGGYVSFNFSPIIDSQGKTFILEFSSPSSSDQDALGLYRSNKPFDGLYMVDGEEKEGSLSFVSYYQPKNIFEVWTMVYGNWINKFFNDLGFAVSYFILVIILFGLLIKLNLFKGNTN